MHAVILAGGQGSRLWPISNKQTPKQFVNIGDENLLQKAFKRASNIDSVQNIITITNSDYLAEVKKSYSHIPKIKGNKYSCEIIIEPSPKDTAAAITAAAVHISLNYGPNQPIIILPSDHIITDSSAFIESVQKAKKMALQNKIVTLGIKPTHPETNYGYIEYNENEVVSFKEKPSLTAAIEYIASGKFLWNSGILCFTVGVLINEMKKYCPSLLSIIKQSINRSFTYGLDDKEIFLNEYLWDNLPKISIDYALLEKTNQIAVLPCSIGWNDVGNWQAMSKMGVKDEKGNSIKGNVTLHDSNNCYVENKSQKTIALIGVQNLTVIETKEGFLIMDKNNAVVPKEIFATLQEKSIL